MDYQCTSPQESFSYINEKAKAAIDSCQLVIKACESQDQVQLFNAIRELMANSARVSLGYEAMNYYPANVSFTVKE